MKLGFELQLSFVEFPTSVFLESFLNNKVKSLRVV